MFQWIQLWASLYANHALLRTIVAFLHIGGLALGGGTAISADLANLAAYRRAGERPTALARLVSSHRVVVPALAVVFISGFLQLGSDLSTFTFSRVFWIKMSLVALLLVNGLLLLRAERAALGDDAPQVWRRLRRASWTSLTLWLGITFLGAALLNI
ncbi:MAG TPA: hypothetical protein VN515_06870 [Terriglobales bacterium]|nr:hypothetical protein [Terriglobales bacterium]